MRSIREIEAKIAELQRRWPPHSVQPAMLQQLDELEEELAKARQTEGCSAGSAA